MSDPKNNGLNAKAPGPGSAGEYTRAAGFLSYYEVRNTLEYNIPCFNMFSFLQICDRINNKGWTVVQDSKRRMGPYAYNEDQWVSFDDKEMVQQKAQFIRQLGLGGGMFTEHCLSLSIL